jgi:hypothetical protein
MYPELVKFVKQNGIDENRHHITILSLQSEVFDHLLKTLGSFMRDDQATLMVNVFYKKDSPTGYKLIVQFSPHDGSMVLQVEKLLVDYGMTMKEKTVVYLEIIQVTRTIFVDDLIKSCPDIFK